MVKEYWSQDNVNKVIDSALRKQSRRGVYAPLLARMQVYIDDEIPPSVRSEMRVKNHAPMCVSGGYKLNIDRKYVWENLNEAREGYLKEGSFCFGMNSLQEEIENILIHEFTHALCQHSNQGKEFFKKAVESEKGVPKREYMAWMMACEVEANRGYGIRKNGSPIYWAGVTDEYTYPKAKSAKYLRDIYEVILKEYGDDLEDDYEDVKREVEKMIKEAQKEAQQKGNQNGEKGGKDGEKGDGSTGQGSSEGSGSTSKDNEDNKRDRGGGSNGGSSNNEENEGVEDSSQNGGSGDSEDPADKARQQRIKALANVLADPSNQITPRQFDPDFDAFDQKTELTDGELGNAGGLGGGGIDVSGKTPAEVLQEWDNIYSAKIVEKALAKLKGQMAGTISKERVSTYSRQARRDSSDGLLKKGTKRSSRSVPKILVALDKSGSMSSTTTAQATEALAKIFEVTGRPTQGCWICLHDGAVSDVEPFKRWKSVVARFWPSGGNDFSEVVKLANKLGVDVVLNVGDAGDRLTRYKKACSEFRKAGRRWIDVNITKGSREYTGEWVEEMFAEDYAKSGIVREWQDLTGAFEYSPDEVIEEARKMYPDAVAKWGKR